MILRIPAGRGEFIPLLNEQPLVAFTAVLHVYHGELALEFLAVQADLQIAARELLFDRRIAEQFPRAAIPEHHAARAVIAGRNVAFELTVFEGMVLHFRGQVLGERFERRAFGNGPGNQDAADLQAEIVMQARGIVPLYVEIGAARCS